MHYNTALIKLLGEMGVLDGADADGEPIGSGERISGPAAPRELAAAGDGRRKREDRGAIFHQQLIGRIDAVPLDEREFRMV